MYTLVRPVLISIFAIILLLGIIWYYLNRPLGIKPVPADFNCTSISEGTFVPMDNISGDVYAVGLSYAGHINETASDFDPDGSPPIFKKKLHSVVKNGAEVNIPSNEEILSVLEEIEPGIRKLLSDYESIPPLMDYETEMGFILLEDVSLSQLNDNNFIPPLGYFLANDLTARSLMVLGEGRDKKYDYWGAAKSFEGFLPMANEVWVPTENTANTIPCVILETLVNGQLKQHQSTSDLIYTPLQMLHFIKLNYPTITQLNKGDIILTGTPGGVLFTTPRWLVRLSTFLNLDRFRKLSTVTKKKNVEKFLKSGDIVEVRAEGLGSVTVTLK